MKKIPVTLSGMQPATFRLLAQWLNHLRLPLTVLIFNAQKYWQGNFTYFYKKNIPLQILANSRRFRKYCSYIQIKNRSYSYFCVTSRSFGIIRLLVV